MIGSSLYKAEEGMALHTLKGKVLIEKGRGG